MASFSRRWCGAISRRHFSGGRIGPALVADVVGGEHQVDLAVGGRERPREERDVEVRDPLHDRGEQLLVDHGVDEHLLEPPHVPRGLEEVAVRDHEARVAVRAGRARCGRAGRRSPTTSGSGQRCASISATVSSAGQGVVLDLVVGARAVADGPPHHAPRVGALRERRAPVRRGDLHDVHERLQVVAPPSGRARAARYRSSSRSAGGLMPAHTMRDRDAVGGLVPQREPHPLAPAQLVALHGMDPADHGAAPVVHAARKRRCGPAPFQGVEAGPWNEER